MLTSMRYKVSILIRDEAFNFVAEFKNSKINLDQCGLEAADDQICKISN